ncbi:DUF805 domain-containing protein [Acinetobacter baumannii]
MNFTALSGISALMVWAFWLFLIYLNIILVVRRLHDLNKSGWMGLLLFIPVVQFFLCFIYCLLLVQRALINMVLFGLQRL